MPTYILLPMHLLIRRGATSSLTEVILRGNNYCMNPGTSINPNFILLSRAIDFFSASIPIF